MAVVRFDYDHTEFLKGNDGFFYPVPVVKSDYPIVEGDQMNVFGVVGGFICFAPVGASSSSSVINMSFELENGKVLKTNFNDTRLFIGSTLVSNYILWGAGNIVPLIVLEGSNGVRLADLNIGIKPESVGLVKDRTPYSPYVYNITSAGAGTASRNTVSSYHRVFYEQIASSLYLSTGFSVSFVTNGGTQVETISGRTNLPDPLPTTTRDGFAFTGWYTDSSLVFPAIPGAEISEDTTLYAGWRPNQFTVTFETNGGEPVGQLTNVNHLPDPLPTTLKVGNDFAGWFTDSELLHPAVPGAVISQNTTLYAKWVEQQSTDIHVPTVSTPSLLQTGFVTMWNPTLEEVRELSNFLWTTNLFDNLRKLFNDPMEAILFLGIVPFDVNTAERSNIYFGNLDTDVESSPVVQQYYTLDFGDIDMTEYYHSFLDYEPATTVEIFLPFCGTHKLSANEVMGSVMNLKYNVDVFTGTCVAMLTITKPGIDSVMYSFEGNLMATIPVTAKNYSDFIRSVVGSVALVGAML